MDNSSSICYPNRGKYIFKYHCGANTYFENERGYIELPRGEFFPNMYEYKEPIN